MACEKDSEVYKMMKKRYKELKVILNSMGVNLTEIDIINEQKDKETLEKRVSLYVG